MTPIITNRAKRTEMRLLISSIKIKRAIKFEYNNHGENSNHFKNWPVLRIKFETWKVGCNFLKYRWYNNYFLSAPLLTNS